MSRCYKIFSIEKLKGGKNEKKQETFKFLSIMSCVIPANYTFSFLTVVWLIMVNGISILSPLFNPNISA